MRSVEEIKAEIGALPRHEYMKLVHWLSEQDWAKWDEDFFTVATTADFASVTHDFHEEIDKDHGRLEVRRYWITEDLRTLPDHPLWARLRSIGMVERHCTIGTTETVERRYFINSIPAQAKRFANAVRGHWGWNTACIGDST